MGIFQYDELKSSKVQVKPKISLVAEEGKNLDQLRRGEIFGQAQNLARKLMEMPSNILTPKKFTEESTALFQDVPNTRLIVHDQHWAKLQNMNAFLAVAKGSNEPLQFMEIHYNGGTQSITDIALVGKGITFDSGGISIKPSANMGMMKGDMGGAAVTLATIVRIT